jgi:hypothetical protein
LIAPRSRRRHPRDQRAEPRPTARAGIWSPRRQRDRPPEGDPRPGQSYSDVIIKTEAASTLAFGREIARTGSRRRLGEGRWRLLCRLGARRGLDRSIRSPRLPAWFPPPQNSRTFPRLPAAAVGLLSHFNRLRTLWSTTRCASMSARRLWCKDRKQGIFDDPATLR